MVDRLYRVTRFMLIVLLAGYLSGSSVDGSNDESSWSMRDYSYGIPMSITNFTMPGFLVLSAVPHTTWPAGKGRLIGMMQFSSVNYYQVSPEVEEYMALTRGDSQRKLNEKDIDYIVSLPEGQGFYIDAELTFANMFLVYGLTDHIDLACKVSAVYYSGGFLDSVVFNFHDTFGFGQQGRQYAEDNQFQYVVGSNGEVFAAALEKPTSGGLLDPQIFLRYAFPMEDTPWSASAAFGVKPPINTSSNNLIATDRWDFGVFLGLERRWERDTFVLNTALVYPGRIVAEDTDSASYNRLLMPSVNLSWLHRFKYWQNTELFVQTMFSEHPLRELVDSEFTDFDFQLTAGIKHHTPYGVMGFGFTENLFNMDNTPDIGFHVSWDWAIGK